MLPSTKTQTLRTIVRLRKRCTGWSRMLDKTCCNYTFTGLIIKSVAARCHWGYILTCKAVFNGPVSCESLYFVCSLFLPSLFTYPFWCCWHFNRPVRLVAGGHRGKQEKNSLVRAFRMMPVNRIATIYDVDWSLAGMFGSLPFRFRISLSAIIKPENL